MSRAVRSPRGLTGPGSNPAGLWGGRTITDAQVVDAVRDIAWTTKADGTRKLAPEGLYGRRKMTAHLRRTTMPEASAGSVDRAMRVLGLVGVRRDKGVRTTIPAKDGHRAGDLLNRDFTEPAPNVVWVTDFERHEALLNRAVVKGHRYRSVVAGRGKLRTA